MHQSYPPIHPRCNRILHGGDYNPDQWTRTPEIWDEDILREVSGSVTLEPYAVRLLSVTVKEA